MKSKQKIEAMALGATLFMPASHKNVESVLFFNRYSDLRSVVIDFEDGLNDDAIEYALDRLERLLADSRAFGLLLFIRPRDSAMLKRLVAMADIERIDGFVLPKFSLDTMSEYLLHVKGFYFMPSIEGLELFDINTLQLLRKRLLAYKQEIIAIRFGAEDMLKQLGLKRNCKESLFDLHVTSHIISNIIITFKPYGFDIAAPVYPCYSDEANYIRQIEQEFKMGLVSKTIIHPNQIAPLHTLYSVDKKELEKAEKIVESSEAVVGYKGEMLERHTQLKWAKSVLKRHTLYGLMED